MAEQLELVRAPLPGLRPFWRYYGGKWRAAPLYPQPMHPRIVELFAGAAGYSLRYPDREVVLVEKDPAIASIWRFLLAAEPHEIEAVPLAERIDTIPSWVPPGMRALIRQLFAAGSARPQNWLSPGFVRQFAEHPTWSRGWDDIMRRRIAAQVPLIRHWRLIAGDYTEAIGCIDASTTTFVDPPYCSPAGAKYATLPGQVIVCENEGATWLPFRKFGTFRRGMNGAGSREVVYYQVDGEQRDA